MLYLLVLVSYLEQLSIERVDHLTPCLVFRQLFLFYDSRTREISRSANILLASPSAHFYCTIDTSTRGGSRTERGRVDGRSLHLFIATITKDSLFSIGEGELSGDGLVAFPLLSFALPLAASLAVFAVAAASDSKRAAWSLY